MRFNLSRSAGSSGSVRVIFLHHSVGADLVKYGDVRGLLRQEAPSVELWDHAYNPISLRTLARSVVRRQPLMPDHYYGLRDGHGRRVVGSFNVPRDNTDPDGLAAVFGQPVSDPPDNTLSSLLQFDVLAFKSCFTIFPIRSEQQLESFKRSSRSIRDGVERHPSKFFVPMTPPPLRANLTTPEQAALAWRFATWMMSEEFHGNLPNVVPFDLFGTLAVPEGSPQAHTLRPEYCQDDPGDTHPNITADRAVAPAFVRVLTRAIGQRSRLPSSLATG
jgi:hypothetical protein